MSPGPPRYRTGNEELDRLISELVAEAAVGRDADLVFEMVVSTLRMGREAADRAELKLVNSALKELRYSFLVFDPYAAYRKVAIFGSARTHPDDPGYDAARDLGQAMADEDWMVITGAGPGIMEAGVEGAGADRAFGVNIVLPFEAEPTALLAGDPKLINFRYFFTRKLMFMKESSAFALLPGGFGTMDEAFELLTLMQTGRHPICPVVLLEPAGSTYWSSWSRFVTDELLGRALISDDDLRLFHIAATVDDAVEEITGFYSTYHSQRFVGRRLVLRLTRDVDDELLATLNRDFTDLLLRGTIERIDATDQEIEDGDAVELPRLALHFDRHHFGRLRALIDRINGRPDRPAPGRPA